MHISSIRVVTPWMGSRWGKYWNYNSILCIVFCGNVWYNIFQHMYSKYNR